MADRPAPSNITARLLVRAAVRPTVWGCVSVAIKGLALGKRRTFSSSA